MEHCTFKPVIVRNKNDNICIVRAVIVGANRLQPIEREGN